MKNLVNQVQLIGNLGIDPEVKTFDNNKMVRFSLATNENYMDKNGEWATQTTWHNIVAWGKLADRVADKLQKGSRLALTGKLKNRSYTAANGDKKYISEVIMQDYLVIPKKEPEAVTPF